MTAKEARQLRQLLDETGGRCWYCGRVITVGGCKGFRAVREHQIPPRRGGPDNLSNMVASCNPCNSRKGNKTLGEYRLWLERKIPLARLRDDLKEILDRLRVDYPGAIELTIAEVIAYLDTRTPNVKFCGETSK